jgi:hypothetical protein
MLMPEELSDMSLSADRIPPAAGERETLLKPGARPTPASAVTAAIAAASQLLATTTPRGNVTRSIPG